MTVLAGCPSETADGPPASGESEQQSSADTAALEDLGGYRELAPPTTRPTLVAQDTLDGSFQIADFEPRGSCNVDNRSQVSRVSPDGEQQWVLDVPFLAGHQVNQFYLSDSTLVLPGIVGVDLVSGEPAWQQHLYEADTRLLQSGEVLFAFRNDHGRRRQVLRRIEPTDGTSRWEKDVEFRFDVAVADGVVVGWDSAKLIATTESGEEAWTRDAPGEEVQVSEANGLVMAREWPGSLLALSPIDGAERWTFESEPGTYVSVLGAHEGLTALAIRRLSGEEGGSAGPRVVVVDGATGQEIWSAPGQDFEIRGSVLTPYGASGAVDFVTGEELRALRPVQRDQQDPEAELLITEQRNGQAVVTPEGEALFVTGPEYEIATAAEVPGMVLVGLVETGGRFEERAGVLVALERSSLAELWRLDYRDAVSVRPRPLPGGDTLIISSDIEIFCD